MTNQSETQWTIAEKDIALQALKVAYQREIENLVKEVRDQASILLSAEDVWHLHDYLSAKRHDIDGKYDEREPFLIFALSKLIKDGWLDPSELDGLGAEKRAKVIVLTRM